ncbi:class I SAM-dependent methyltransferase [Archangium violaceum]|uniref:class I SAM-dependent methyltransferase n=1 Tax=Archangium violaceum TaxID=83451 RepID=UPI00193C640A|nr:class I SAM-dependent methyltransferase [Archangium violaceum]QRK10414.1 class I SAM-dependent methyltransferase [Archangium violaceum]
MNQAKPTKQERYSYSSMPAGLVSRVREVQHLYRMWQDGTIQQVGFTIEAVRQCEKRIKEAFGRELEGLDILDVGPGQQLKHMKVLSVKNRVTGIDMDIVPQGFDLREYVAMLRYNSVLRTAKTLTRKVLGWDELFEKTLARDLSVSGFRRLPVFRMDAKQMSFSDASFDVVCSWSAYEHIAQPRASLQEVTRVLRPGGVAYIAVHLYTSHTGSHDPRTYTNGGRDLPYWPHLRPAHRDAVKPNCYVNEIRMDEWKRMFEETMPGVRFVYERQDELAPALRELREKGELAGYSDDELLTVGLIGMWQKPHRS